MPYSLSRGVHQRPKQNTLRILRMEDCHIFGVKPKSLHPKKLNEEFARIWKQFGSPCHRETINATHNGDYAHFWIEGGQLGNVNWPVQTETGINRLVCNAIQPVTRCPPTPPTKHQNITASLGWNKNRFTPKTPMNSLWEHARVCVSLSQRRNKCCKQCRSCTILDRRWTARECQLAGANQDRDRLMGLQCHTARHEVSTNALNRTP
jgi:hypothetical protein